jgi:hypothetical protein
MPGKVEIVAEEKHGGDVTSVAYYDGKVYTAGADGKLKVTVGFELFRENNDFVFSLDFQ